MRRFLFIVCLLILIFVAAYFLAKTNNTEKKITIPVSSHPTNVPEKKLTKSIFVPYWTMHSNGIDSADYQQVIYFGITPNTSGIDTNEVGYKSMHNFLQLTKNSNKLLAVRMTNSDVNKKVLNDKDLQKKIIEQSIQVAKENGFKGVVLDFEISALGFTSVTTNISNFETHFADQSKEQHVRFYATIYGDAFARLRPFDVKTIAAHSDGIMIMAYDYHKANGNPGPNFPLKDNQNEGYDFQTMIGDFLQEVPPEKITVVFGLFGYDWVVDEKGNSTSAAASLSLYKIQQQFLNSCSSTDCTITEDPVSTETKITYQDSDKKNHVVWFENMHSVTQKTEFLKSKGIYSIAYWAYSYF